MASRNGGESPFFKAFLKAYPLMKGSAVTAAREWEMNGCDAIADVIMGALEKHAMQESWRKDRGRYIPSPAKWLAEKRWEYKLTLDVSKPRSNYNAAREQLPAQFQNGEKSS